MLQIDLIHEFLSRKSVAVVGVSRMGDIPANMIFKRFLEAGYEAYPINPNTKEINGKVCYPNLQSLPTVPEAVFLAGTPAVSESTVDDCVELKVPIVWMHKGIGQGSFSEVARQKCEANGIQAIYNGCPMMFIKPVDPFHGILKWFKKF